MTDETDALAEDTAAGEETASGEVHVPLLLRRFRTLRLEGPQIAGDAEPSMAGSDNGDADHIAALLAVKYMKLETAITALRTALPTITASGERLEVTTQIGEAEAERSLCKARHDQIDAGGEFHPVPQSEENALLSALDAVDRSLATTAAVAGLLSAVHKLVTAFPAGRT